MLEKIKKHLEQMAPKIVDALQEPVSDETIERLEKLIDKKLPDDFIALYKEHNGLDTNELVNFAYGIPFFSLEKSIDILENYEKYLEKMNLEYADPQINSSYTLNMTRIPISDDGQVFLAIDLAPTDEGVYGQVILIDTEYEIAIKLNNSITEYLSQFEVDLNNNRYCLQEDALEDGDDWLQPEDEIDPVNWFNSPTWKHIKEQI